MRHNQRRLRKLSPVSQQSLNQGMEKILMARNKQIQNIAIVGTGVIGASWAALYLARGLNVIATDPAPNAEANLRRFIDAAWKDLQVIGLSRNASLEHLQFTTDMKKA